MGKVREYLLLYLKGMAMGGADVIPNVSGGTIAFITGIYDELIHSIRAVDREALRLLIRFRFDDFWKRINGTFLLVLFAGILVSFFTLSRVMLFLLQNHSIKIRSFFFGIILLAALLVLRRIARIDGVVITSLLIGTVIAYAATYLAPFQTPNGAWFMFIAGALSACGMLIPGISAAFVLILMGKFLTLQKALAEPNFATLGLFIAGCITGIAGISRFLSFILKNNHSATVALLAGFMLGSLNKIWPWREVLEFAADIEGKQVPVYGRSLLPWNYFETTGKDPQVFQAILMMALGVFIVVLIEKIAERLKTKI